MDQTKSWILIADASSARIFACHKGLIFQDPQNYRHLEQIQSFEHEKSRKKDRDLVTDKMGNFGYRSTFEEPDPKTHEAQAFAIELSHFVESARAENQFKDLTLVAPPAMMGHLKQHLTHETKKTVVQTIEKDYTKQSGADLLKSLVNHL